MCCCNYLSIRAAQYCNYNDCLTLPCRLHPPENIVSSKAMSQNRPEQKLGRASWRSSRGSIVCSRIFIYRTEPYSYYGILINQGLSSLVDFRVLLSLAAVIQQHGDIASRVVPGSVWPDIVDKVVERRSADLPGSGRPIMCSIPHRPSALATVLYNQPHLLSVMLYPVELQIET